MQKIDIQFFDRLLDESNVKLRLKRELRFNTSVSHLEDSDWHELEMIHISNRSGNEGVLLLGLSSSLYLIPYIFNKMGASTSTGRPQPIICDFCRTWQSGTRAATITFTNVKSSKSSVTHLCCGDLRCSDHVRSKTSASKISRTQLREDMDNVSRVDRLNERLGKLMRDLEISPLSSTE